MFISKTRTNVRCGQNWRRWQWEKGVEGTNIGNFNPKSEINEAQLRIDGFEDVPEITRAVVQEIEV